jgi:hypothetical protein
VATENGPLYELSGPRIWCSEDEALKMMDDNDVSVAMLSHTGRLPQNPRMVKAMRAIRDRPLGRTKPMRTAMRRAPRQLDDLRLDTVVHQVISRTNAIMLFRRLRHH